MFQLKKIALEPITINDFPCMPEFEPPGWGDLVPRFRHAISVNEYEPYKITEQGRPVAIGTIIYHGDSAWLASIIVHPDSRNKGYGKLITQAMIDEIDTNQYTTISLDATDLGFPVYKSLGFTHEATYAHFKSDENVTGLVLSTSIIPYREDMLDQLLTMDRSVSCEDRKVHLSEHLAIAMVYFQSGKIGGFFLPSFGNGLIVAEDKVAGIELLKYRLENNYFAIFPAENQNAMEYLQHTSLKQFRLSRRMYIGQKRKWQAHCMYNRISGQLG